jgi:hypothetical protein
VEGVESVATHSSTAASPKTPSYLKLSCSLGGYRNNSYASPGQQKKLIVLKRRTESEDELDCTETGGMGGGGGKSEGLGDHEHTGNGNRNRNQNQNGGTNDVSVIRSPSQPREIPVTIRQISTNKDTNDASKDLNASANGVEVSVTSSPVVVANGDVSAVQNGVDEVDFSIARIGQRSHLEKTKSQEELDTPTPSKVGWNALVKHVSGEEKIRKQESLCINIQNIRFHRSQLL